MWYGYKMKIAICISGQLRDSWRDCIPTWKICLKKTLADFLFHMDKQTASMLLPANKDKEEKQIHNTEINEVNVCKPQGIQQKNPKIYTRWNGSIDPNYRLPYGVMMACLK